MDEIDLIREIEENSDVKSIKVKGMEVWPFLRTYYFAEYSRKYVFKPKLGRKAPIWTFRKQRIKNMVYGLWNLFSKYEYVIFSDVLELRLMNGKYVNKLFDFLIRNLGPITNTDGLKYLSLLKRLP